MTRGQFLFRMETKDLEERLAHWRNASDPRARRLRKLIQRAARYSPIDGVVTEVRLPAGSWTPGRQPVVRVDDPRGYRLVLLLEERKTAGLKRGAVLSGPSGVGKWVVERTLAGWGREFFYTWVTLRPQSPEALTPGQRVAVLLPRRDG